MSRPTSRHPLRAFLLVATLCSGAALAMARTLAGPTAQDPHETHRENGKVRTEDGRAVRSDDGERNNRSDHQDA
ncbi:hypothetical protein KGZ13_33505, partial [Pseudomonas aeruginosa]|nr:hypothetical protein [Pseudomonas aeruginosa]